ncbi:hypothetical protein EYF80_029687 [Liparis tanakae]|uniref:Uncharacterized protein n=1 Tax=Liparis tanakae TaxID=230148 RepID=A0A4Z2H4C1_9TELE|nr:hypothetical protein EYF80_029687 [Liparis tanakae]
MYCTCGALPASELPASVYRAEALGRSEPSHTSWAGPRQLMNYSAERCCFRLTAGGHDVLCPELRTGSSPSGRHRAAESARLSDVRHRLLANETRVGEKGGSRTCRVISPALKTPGDLGHVTGFGRVAIGCFRPRRPESVEVCLGPSEVLTTSTVQEELQLLCVC